jgi:hypothetical protein
MEDYGRSPAINVLPAIRAAQVIKQSLVTAIEFMARPALGAHDDLLDQLIMYAPGGISYGAIDDRGNPLIKKLLDDPDISGAAQLLAETQKVIQRAFFEDLYIVRQELKSHISAAEQLIRDAQRGIMLSPLKRQENEWFTLQVDRELDLMNDMGMLDDMPVEVREEGGLFQIEYDNPLAIARNASEAAAFYETLNGLTPLMQLSPEQTVPAFFREFPFERVLASLAAIRGVPVSFRATDDEKADNDAANNARRQAGNRAQRRSAGGRDCRQARPGHAAAAGERCCGMKDEAVDLARRLQLKGPALLKQAAAHGVAAARQARRGGGAVPRRQRRAQARGARHGSPARATITSTAARGTIDPREHAKREGRRELALEIIRSARNSTSTDLKRSPDWKGKLNDRSN